MKAMVIVSPTKCITMTMRLYLSLNSVLPENISMNSIASAITEIQHQNISEDDACLYYSLVVAKDFGMPT